MPLNGSGRRDASGRIVLLSIGMSNTTQEFTAFVDLAGGSPELNPRLILVDGAQGGQTAAIIANPHANFWSVVYARLASAGVTAQQVQVVWMKQANAQPAGEFPVATRKLEADLVSTLHNLQDRFPNLRDLLPLKPCLWRLRDDAAQPGAVCVCGQLRGEMDNRSPDRQRSGLEICPAKGRGRRTVDCLGPVSVGRRQQSRKQGGLVWLREDLGPDGTHPSDSGSRKVAQLLLQFLQSDPTSKGWFLR